MWGAISQFDLDTGADAGRLQAPFRSGIHIQDYQLDPLVRALQMPRVSLLIADDVGLGKTIEAGLVAQELILRHRARRILIVCPAGLQVQWREQMRDKFGLGFRIIDSDLMRRLRRERGIHVNPWGHHPRLIVSLDYLKRVRPMHLFRQAVHRTDGRVFPRWGDLLIVDEAHNAAPVGTANYVSESDRTKAVRAVVSHFEHKLFLTATPHDGNPDSFTALLEMLDDQRFARGVMPEPAQLHQVMVRRMKSELKKNWDGSSRFPERHIRTIEADYSDAEIELHALLQRYADLRTSRAKGDAAPVATGFVFKTLKKRLFSSPAAFATTFEKHRSRLTGGDDADERDVVASAGAKALARYLAAAEDDVPADDDEAEQQLADVVDVATTRMADLSEDELDLIVKLRARAEAAANRPDAKVKALVAWLDANIRPGGRWSDERVIIFTEYKATQQYIYEQLANHGYTTGGRIELMYGGMDLEQREKIKQAFQAHPSEPGAEVRILLATDTASEGIDLQNHCSKLIHIEIPWNPNVMEQRNGRIDRYGQLQDAVDIFHFVPVGYDHETVEPDAKPGDLAGDLEFLYRAVKKVDQIREDLGKVGPVIAEQVEQALVGGTRTRLDTANAEGGDRPDRRLLQFQRNLDDDVQRLREQLRASRQELDLSPEGVADVVHKGLALAGQPPLEPAGVHGLWPDPSRQTCPVWHLPHLSGTWSPLLEGLEDPHSRRIRPIVFDQALVERRTDVVLAHLNHPLVQRCLRLLRAHAWTHAHGDTLRRVSVQVVEDTMLDTPAVIAYGRLVVLGGDAQRIHEEIVSAGGTITEGRFRRFDSRREIDAAIDAAHTGPIAPTIVERLGELWEKVEPALTSALEARVKDRTATLESRLAARSDREVGDVETVLGELAARIESELTEPTGQLQFTLDEQQQLARDVAALQARLAALPNEIALEVDRIRKRYGTADPRLFPFAVVFLVPHSIAEEGL
jgi:superfamily II DNA or RNA helicase